MAGIMVNNWIIHKCFGRKKASVRETFTLCWIASDSFHSQRFAYEERKLQFHDKLKYIAFTLKLS